MQQLIWISQMKKPSIFLLEEDNDSRSLLNKLLKDKGYKVKSSASREDALQRTQDELIKSDLILMGVVGKSSEEALSVGQQLRQNSNPVAPLVVIVPKYPQDKEGTNEEVGKNEYFAYLGENAEEFIDLLASLTENKQSDLPN